MAKEQIEEILRAANTVQADSRLEIEERDNKTFRVTEYGPDKTVRKRLSGYHHVMGGIITTEEPDLTDEQRPVFESILGDLSPKVAEAVKRKDKEFFLMRFGDYPTLFDMQYAHPNIAGNTKEGLLQVWHAIEDMLQVNGYRPFHKQAHGDAPEDWEIWAMPLRTP